MFSYICSNWLSCTDIFSDDAQLWICNHMLTVYSHYCTELYQKGLPIRYLVVNSLWARIYFLFYRLRQRCTLSLQYHVSRIHIGRWGFFGEKINSPLHYNNIITHSPSHIYGKKSVHTDQFTQFQRRIVHGLA